MSLFPKKEVVLSSPMKGTVTFKGKPAVGAIIKRTIRWQNDGEQTDSVISDKAGAFHFNLVKSSLRQWLPAEFVVYQDIYVEYQGDTYHIWVMSKREESNWAELGGKPVNFRCELTDAVERVEVDRGLLGTACKWDFIQNME